MVYIGTYDLPLYYFSVQKPPLYLWVGTRYVTLISILAFCLVTSKCKTNGKNKHDNIIPVHI